jgi:hypothetical protein
VPTYSTFQSCESDAAYFAKNVSYSWIFFYDAPCLNLRWIILALWTPLSFSSKKCLSQSHFRKVFSIAKDNTGPYIVQFIFVKAMHASYSEKHASYSRIYVLHCSPGQNLRWIILALWTPLSFSKKMSEWKAFLLFLPLQLCLHSMFQSFEWFSLFCKKCKLLANIFCDAPCLNLRWIILALWTPLSFSSKKMFESKAFLESFHRGKNLLLHLLTLLSICQTRIVEKSRMN